MLAMAVRSLRLGKVMSDTPATHPERNDAPRSNCIKGLWLGKVSRFTEVPKRKRGPSAARSKRTTVATQRVIMEKIGDRSGAADPPRDRLKRRMGQLRRERLGK